MTGNKVTLVNFMRIIAKVSLSSLAAQMYLEQSTDKFWVLLSATM